MLNFFQLWNYCKFIERFDRNKTLQRTEVLEVEEFFGKKQKGSSAMPHKKKSYFK